MHGHAAFIACMCMHACLIAYIYWLAVYRTSVIAAISRLEMNTSGSEANERLCSPCRRRVLACACMAPKHESTEFPYPIQAEDKNSTEVSALQGTKFQYVITSDKLDLDHEQLGGGTDLDADDFPSLPNISMAVTVDGESDLKLDSLEDQLCQMLVMQSPDIINLKRQLKEQRVRQQKEFKLLQQIEMEMLEYKIKYKELQQHVVKMQLRKEFFKNMQGINT